jgi:hypothetical protein
MHVTSRKKLIRQPNPVCRTVSPVNCFTNMGTQLAYRMSDMDKFKMRMLIGVKDLDHRKHVIEMKLSKKLRHIRM